ncbi:transposase, mutator type (plasmid) [Athalassotoga saccharophila]|uniref:Mutator family transposase n=1 Tax=Athalassotoga saccharophila TaxID=1441386 RepID=A0A6N4TEB6_9BACT|nr:IS256 family transposase [Athalassotoga saccharophila]BBJ29123.1 transposase, mutator type [Athalassotoga saccharophila]
MEKKRLMSKDEIRKFIKDNDIKDIAGIEESLKRMFSSVIEEMLEAELEDQLGYTKYDYKSKMTDNSRNGKSKKTVMSKYGETEIEVPRDRNSDFEPQVVKKRQRDISGIEDRIISMYANGMTFSEIGNQIEDIYGAELSNETLSRITDKIIPLMEEWRNRRLEEVYAIVYLDGIRYNVRENEQVINKTVYFAVGIDLGGQKDVLGMWIAETETSKYWAKVLSDLRNRGVKDILIMTTDGLSGMKEAVEAIYPETELQGCVVHVIRNGMKYVSYKDLKEFSKDTKSIYQAPTEESARKGLNALKEKWSEKYPLAVNVWEKSFDRISTMYQFTPEIRKLIYTTNPIESFNMQLRRKTKNVCIK